MSRSPQHALSPPALSEQVRVGEMKGISGTIDTESHNIQCDNVFSWAWCFSLYPFCHSVILSSVPPV